MRCRSLPQHPLWAPDTMTKQASVAQANGDATNTLLASLADFSLHPPLQLHHGQARACGWLVVLCSVLRSPSPSYQLPGREPRRSVSSINTKKGQMCVSRLSVCRTGIDVGIDLKERRRRRGSLEGVTDSLWPDAHR
ncbi:hypothetical protein J3F83DRAFT_406189 [Trichoderma novae-zelandiae]